MEFGKKISEVGKSASALFLIDIMAEIRPLLEDAGLILPGGLVMITENIGGVGTIKRFFQQTRAVHCKKLTASEWAMANNKISYHIHQKFDKELDSLRFLAEEGFTPVILLHSFLPEHLKDYGRLIVLQGEGDFQDGDVQAGKDFKDFIHKEPGFLENSIKFFKSSEFYLQHKWEEETNMALEASATAFCDYYRMNHAETETQRLHRHFHDTIQLLAEREECCSGEWDVLDAVRNVIEKYLMENQQIKIGSKDAVEGELARANQKFEAILWDYNMYYITEKVLKNACAPLLGMVSFLEIKRELRDKGYLVCNSIADGNFTVKKVVTSAMGSTSRQRFLQIRREFFDQDGGLTLPERRSMICRSELQIEHCVAE